MDQYWREQEGRGLFEDDATSYTSENDDSINSLQRLIYDDPSVHDDLQSDYDSSSFNVDTSPVAYPSWNQNAEEPPVTMEGVQEILLDLTNKLGFQKDNMRNIFDYVMVLLDSRASRMSPSQALLTLHADVIGGIHANFAKWYFASHFNDGHAIGFHDMSSPIVEKMTLKEAEQAWRDQMGGFSPHRMMVQLCLYFLCWGEANNIRFMPECLCFIYKCAYDYYISSEARDLDSALPKEYFLDSVITPVYRFFHAQLFEVLDGKYVRRERDHASNIGYDDINQFFWSYKGLEEIKCTDKTPLLDLPPFMRYRHLGNVEWKSCFYKTYYEYRSWFHNITNFSRIWVMHIAAYWYYSAYNSSNLYTSQYHIRINNKPPASCRWTACGLAGAIASFITLLAVTFEYLHVPRRYHCARPLWPSFLMLLTALLLNIAPTVFIFASTEHQQTYISRLVVGIVHFFFSLVCVVYFAVTPLRNLVGFTTKSSGHDLANRYFTSNFTPTSKGGAIVSWCLWITVLVAKYCESYFFLALNLSDSIRYLGAMRPYDCGDYILGAGLCRAQPKILLSLLYLTDLSLFFLDTYLWYILISTIYSLGYAFYLGISVWTPWRELFYRVPRRIYTKLLHTDDMEISFKPKVLVSQVWNAIIISMYREHLISRDQIQELLYHQVPSEKAGYHTLRAPNFFYSQQVKHYKQDLFPANSEAARRISFFAQSLAESIPKHCSVDAMPTFTVLVPHYSEKILLSLREIIREEDQLSRVTLLEYLKQLYPIEWKNFVDDTKLLADESESVDSTVDGEKNDLQAKAYDLPFYCIGFKSATPEYTLRTRIWASLRTQTLYRTINGFSNYSRALKLLYRTECPELVEWTNGDPARLDEELDVMANRKFRFCVSMQRYAKFTKEESENAEFLLRAYPDLQIAYMDEDAATRPAEERGIYSVLIDGHCPIMENGKRRPKYRIRLSGNPILGDGKSDNQNMSIPYIRGEYVQMVDANQDNYLEECLKIRNILAEFEQFTPPLHNPYSVNAKSATNHPVAILGAREYIFSENTGMLGDVAAAKEQCFGTMFARILSLIGGKLHYGHPDFINVLFMTTRGGVSKAQKGLHVNEDIYAGMTALQRGGRIKHSDYYQCGKGRDLGFGSILNFTTKIGTGMAEQMLSREYFHLGTQLPFDRFLSFFYAHAGFHVNNMVIMFSLQLLMLVIINLGAMFSVVPVCNYRQFDPVTAPLSPRGCYQLQPVLEWLKRCILSIFIVFGIAFVPLAVCELNERGALRMVIRVFKQIFSLSPIFEIFTCQIYAQSLIANLSFGGARYIGTSRGFATVRVPFALLYSRFSGPSLYFGSRLMFMLLYGSITAWLPHYIYFWITLVALCVSPFLYNPHQFSWTDFFVDYREFIRWTFRENSRNHSNSWIGNCQLSRTRVTGYKRKIYGKKADKISMDSPRARITTMFYGEILGPLGTLFFTCIPFLFANSQPGNEDISKRTNAFIRLIIMSLIPLVLSGGIAILFFCLGIVLRPLVGGKARKVGIYMAAAAHILFVFVDIIVFEVLGYLEGWTFSITLLGFIAITSIHRFAHKLLIICFLSREFRHDGANLAWWSGLWNGQGFGYMVLTQPWREFVCKTTEINMFAGDFLLSHLLLFLHCPIILIPYIDKFHSIILFWLRPSRQIRPPVYTIRQNKLRRQIVFRYATLYFTLFVIFFLLLILPFVFGNSAAGVSYDQFNMIQPSIRIMPSTKKNSSV
ncbi:primary septum and spore wall linear 1,3-beta-glucan synthase catalytic subunit Bgs1 [Schizosaccharomyces osmophilus]|uniref:1,3-beta-glucan synthase n=1 Tax=Schizosaccharomyces osmophilus TaxID=2545709 RepID=A0AAE9WCC9_9SCHI|nr:primary septum and spore wall linear 1,3-beta-glucan synthase catalytic subunit Bgs1 [Schizosaccharomyces osmophilus]WBW73649.1 primary septum and spore wall linear 1,3-beta-glucan synthase catalytic subunit Bgs1 [Schizosaccharomyces osmophilus]